MVRYYDNQLVGGEVLEMARLSNAVIGCLVQRLDAKSHQSSREPTNSIFLAVQTQRTPSLSRTRIHPALCGITTSSWCCDRVENNDEGGHRTGQAQAILKTVVMHDV